MRRNQWFSQLPALGIFLALILSVVAIALSMQPPRMASFDMKGTLRLFSQQLAAKELSDEEREQAIARFTHAMEVATEAYSREHRMVLLVAPAVIDGAVDATPVIQAAIKVNMQQGVSSGE